MMQTSAPSWTSAPCYDEHLEDVALQRRGERVATAASPPPEPRRSRLGAVRAGALPLATAAAVAAHLDLEALARHLHQVVALDGLGAVLGRRLRLRLRQRLEPLAILDQVAARLRVGPLPGGHDRLVERNQRAHADDLELRQSAGHPPRGPLAVGAQAVSLAISGSYRASSPGRRARRSRRARRARPARVGGQPCPGEGAKPFSGSSATMRHSIARPWQRTASWPNPAARPRRSGSARAPGRRRSLLGHGVLHLHARVHLQEVELAVRQQELDRAGRGSPPRGPRGPRRRHARAQLGRPPRRRRLLDQLLVTALDRAVALAEGTTLPWWSASTWTSTWRGSER